MHKTFPEIEREILQFWEKNNTFQRSLELNKGKPEFIFYDGPPFATGLPHHGNLLAGTIKDVVTRYASQTGHFVERRFGWDTHGLPIEHEIDKMFQITDRRQIIEMGIDVYNEKCRSIVLKYFNDWKRIVARTGRWVDFDNSYKTMDFSFMESVWWVFKQLYEKNLVYRGVKVMPYSTGCKTTLSNSESGLNYNQVNDPCITVSFEVENKDYELVAWTTTPWTLPSNLALAVNPNLVYCVVKNLKNSRKFVMMKDRICELFDTKKKKEFEIEEEFLGKTLEGLKYKPLFHYFNDWSCHGAFRVIVADYVSNEDGTGIVHIAPGFGEDDFNASLKAGIITKDGSIVCPIDDNGCFTSEVKDFEGVYVKDADKLIIDHLKKEGRVVKVGTISHSYPYCYRSDTPLIYRAVPSWFVRIEDKRDELIKKTLETNWVPQSIRDGRFVQWLKSAQDWSISRSRYWGTPIPIWTDDECTEFVVIGSVSELEELSGEKGITDLHMDKIDHITFKSKKSGKTLHRIPEVFDCWFESGSMPYSLNHIPFSGKEWKQADFIAEGLDQTRGWFYTLAILSTFLDHPLPFKNLIVNGIILAEDGKKMSKHQKNYTDPVILMDTIGADPLRLYLINSPAVHAEPFKFKDDGVKQIVKDVMIPWENSFYFFMEQVNKNGNNFKRNEELAFSSKNKLNKWIISRLHRLIKFVHNEMNAYRLYTVLPELMKFIDEMSKWFIRLNKDFIKKGGNDSDEGLSVLFEVLFNFTVLMAPFTPFFSEFIYQQLKKFTQNSNDDVDSVHFLMIPKENEKVIDEEIERNLNYMRSAILVGRAVRDRNRIMVRRPLAEFVIVCSEEIKNQLSDLVHYIKNDLHIMKLTFVTDENKYIKLKATCDGRILGKRLGKKFKEVNKKVQQMKFNELASLYADSIVAKNNNKIAPKIKIDGEEISTDEINFTREFVNPNKSKFDGDVNGQICAFCDLSESELINEITVAREVRKKIQQTRKKMGLKPTDKVDLFIAVEEGNDVWNCLHSTKEEVVAAIGLEIKTVKPNEKPSTGDSFEFAVNNVPFTLIIIQFTIN